MKIFYILIILSVIYVSFIFVRIRYTLHTANLPNIVQSDAVIGQGPPLKYIAAGDSTAVGEGASSVQQTYTYRIAQHLSESHTVEYRNVGVLGAKTDDVITEQLPSIIEFQPDIVTISIGANDVTHLRKNSHTLKNINTILRTLTEKTNAQIYLTDIPVVDRATLLPYPVRALWGYKAKNLNPEILTLENERVHVIDIYNFGWENYPDIQTTFAKDQFHPNDTGYDNWTKAFLSKMP